MTPISGLLNFYIIYLFIYSSNMNLELGHFLAHCNHILDTLYVNGNCEFYLLVESDGRSDVKYNRDLVDECRSVGFRNSKTTNATVALDRHDLMTKFWKFALEPLE